MSTGHETRDFKPIWVGAFVAVLVYAIVVVYMFTFTVFSHFKAGEVTQTSPGLFPQPRLQIVDGGEHVRRQSREPLKSWVGF